MIHAPPSPISRWKAGGAGVNGALYMFAGGSEEGSRNVFFDDLWRMAATSEGNPWTRVAPGEPWPEARRGHWMAPVAGGFVVVGGRERGHNCFRDAWVYAAASNTWTRSRSPE